MVRWLFLLLLRGGLLGRSLLGCLLRRSPLCDSFLGCSFLCCLLCRRLLCCFFNCQLFTSLCGFFGALFGRSLLGRCLSALGAGGFLGGGLCRSFGSSGLLGWG